MDRRNRRPPRLAALALLGLAIGLPRAAPAAVAWEPVWLTAGLGAERLDWLDEDPWYYEDAGGASRSAWLSAGRGQRAWFAGGWERVHVEQATWAWSATRWLAAGGLRVAGGALEPLRLEGGWFRESDGGGPGASAWTTGPAFVRLRGDVRRTLRLRAGATEQATLDLGPGSKARIGQTSLGWIREAGAGRAQLELLGSRRAGERAGALRARWDRTPAAGLVLGLDGLWSDGLEGWTDWDKLVPHDGPQGLEAMATASLGWRFAGGLQLKATVGWEKLDTHETRWFWAGLSWTRLTWRPTEWNERRTER